MRKSWIFATLMLLLGACGEPEQVQVDSTAQVTLYRDQYGTPHVVADSNRGVYFGFGYAVASDRLFGASKWLLDSDSPTTVPSAAAGPDMGTNLRPAYLDELPQTDASRRIALATDGRFLGLTDTPALALQQRQQLAAWGFSSSPEFTGASNFWAARQLSDAQAALVNGPQFGFGVPSYVYGIGLHGGDFNAVGNTLLALPSLLFAHNNHIAWGSTAGMSDQSDEFALTLNSENQEQYHHGGGWRTFDSWPETIQVAGAEPVTVIARRSVHGMVLDYQPENHIIFAASPSLGRKRPWRCRPT